MFRLSSIQRILLVIILTGYSLGADAQRFHSAISTYLHQEKDKWKLSDQDVTNWAVSDQYDNPQTGITYTYLHQQVDGIRIFNAVSTLALLDGKVAHYVNGFHPNAARKANTTKPSLSAVQAIDAAVTHLGLTMAQTPQLLEKEPNRLFYKYTRAGVSREDMTAELVFVFKEDALQLAWNVNISPIGSADWWNIRINALTGQYIEKNNWTVYCDFGQPHAHQGDCNSAMRAQEFNKEAIDANTVSGSYNVYPLPVEAPSFGSRSVLTNIHSGEASPYGWHDTDGFEGPDHTITRGNNVYAYEDRNNFDQPGYSPDGGPGLNFVFPIDLNLPPIENEDAIITNLFYMNNSIHDILYHHGFDELSGNFQETNYSGEADGNDFVLAEAQDGEGTDNAYFSTPPDGFSGKMAMFLWIVEKSTSMQVLSPDSLANYYDAETASFGPALDIPITGYAVLLRDETEPENNGCDSIINAAELEGKIAILDKGSCSFIKKVLAAEAIGAIAVIVVNDTDAPPFVMGGSGAANIPAVMISKANGQLLKSALLTGDTVEVTLAFGAGETSQNRDGSLDNGIIAHEYGHGLSTRLTGGRFDSDCLWNADQGGEGWSDWLTLILTIEPGDTGAEPRGIGTYATVDETGVGIRRYPYSTDMNINPLTYANVASSFGVHAIGEIWCSTIWDLTWKLIEKEGFDQDWFHGTGGNNTAMRLVIEGMKLQGCNPGYISARDGILAADELLFQGANKCMIMEVFARRGLGAYADQGSSFDSRDQTPDFTIPNTCIIATVAPTALFAVEDTSDCFGKFSFTDLSTDIPQYYAWDFGDGNISEEANPTHTYAEKGTYLVTAIVTNNIGADTFQIDVSYEDLQAPSIIGNTVVCEGSTTSLVADVLSGNTATWSIGDSIVYTGTTFETPVLSSSTTYAVQQVFKPAVHAGPADNSFGGGGIHTSDFEGRIYFETIVPLKIKSVLIYAEGDGNRTITLYDIADNIVQIVDVFLVNGENRVTLDLDIPTPGVYALANQSGNLYRNNSNASYPYTVANVISLLSSNAPGNEFGFYYYFYDWKVQEPSCESAPKEVLVTVEPGPVAGFMTDAIDLEVSFTDISAGDATTWSWDFGDGSPVVFDQNPVHIYSEEGTYEVELIVSNGSCLSVIRQTIEVANITGSQDLEDISGLRIYPNPASDEVTVEFLEGNAGYTRMHITNATGGLALTRTMDLTGKKYTINTSTLPAGTYQVQIFGPSGVAVRKVTIIR